MKKLSKQKFKKLPYLDTKVVKVEKEIDWKSKPLIMAKKMGFGKWIECPECGKLNWRSYKKHSKPKVSINIVNGENLDKIRFPFFCRFGRKTDKLKLGMVAKTLMYDPCTTVYTLIGIEKQNIYNESLTVNSIESLQNLEELIKKHDIHILKGKIIIFEEE